MVSVLDEEAGNHYDESDNGVLKTEVSRNTSASDVWQTEASRTILSSTECKRTSPESISTVGGTIIKSRDDTRSTSRRLKIYQWLLTLLCAVLLCNNLGFITSLGVFFVEIIDTFQETRAQTSLIQSVSMAVMYGSGAVGSALLSRFGQLRVGICGGTLAATGFIAATFAHSVLMLIICVGVLGGFGLGLLYLIPFSVIGVVIQDEQMKRLLLSVIAFGSGLGAVIYPYLCSVLIGEFGWRGTFLLLSGIILHSYPMNLAIYTLVPRIHPPSKITKRSKKDPWGSRLNLSLFRNISFLTVCFSIVMIAAFSVAINIFLVDIARHKGFHSESGAFFLSMSGLARLGGGVVFLLLFVASRNFTGLAVLSVTLLIGGLCTLLIAYADTYVFMLVAVILYGLPWGVAFMSLPTVILDVFGSDKYTSAFGYIITISALGDLVAGPLGGTLRDLTGTYDALFYVSMSGSLASSLSLFLIWTWRRSKRTKDVGCLVNEQTVSTRL